jgi:hypothetical protein
MVSERPVGTSMHSNTAWTSVRSSPRIASNDMEEPGQIRAKRRAAACNERRRVNAPGDGVITVQPLIDVAPRSEYVFQMASISPASVCTLPKLVGPDNRETYPSAAPISASCCCPISAPSQNMLGPGWVRNNIPDRRKSFSTKRAKRSVRCCAYKRPISTNVQRPSKAPRSVTRISSPGRINVTNSSGSLDSTIRCDHIPQSPSRTSDISLVFVNRVSDNAYAVLARTQFPTPLV